MKVSCPICPICKQPYDPDDAVCLNCEEASEEPAKIDWDSLKGNE